MQEDARWRAARRAECCGQRRLVAGHRHVPLPRAPARGRERGRARCLLGCLVIP
jgi:hypothetical protein